MKRTRFLFVMVMITATLPGYAQQPTAAEADHAKPLVQQKGHEQHFKLTFVVREVDERGKVLNSREYTTSADDSNFGAPNASIRTGARVPTSTAMGNQWQYVEVGVNFDVSRLQVLAPTKVGMVVAADLSSFDTSSDSTKNRPPEIHQNKWTGNEQMTLGQPKVIFSSDDLTSKNKVQVELTVTEVK